MNNLVAKYVLPYAKAHMAGFGLFVTALLFDTNYDFSKLGNLTGHQWTDAVIASGILGGLVGVTVNKPAPAPFAPVSAGAPDAAPVADVAPVAQDA